MTVVYNNLLIFCVHIFHYNSALSSDAVFIMHANSLVDIILSKKNIILSKKRATAFLST